MSEIPQEQPEPSRRSSWLVYTVVWVALVVLMLFPSAPLLGLQGGLWLGLGVLIVVQPPWIALPRWIWGLGLAFLVLSAAAFSPKSWFGIPEWRQGLDAAGLATGNLVTAHAQQSGWQWLQLCALGLMVIYLLGHRVTDRCQLRLAWLFSFGVALTAALAIAAQTLGWVWPWDADPSFGFFPNRNHMATVLALGGVTALGCLLQSIHSKRFGFASLAALNLCCCLGAILVFCQSRAGLLLLGLGTLIWVLGLGKRYLTRKLVITSVALLALAGGLFFWMGGDLKARFEKTAARVQTSFRHDPTATTQEVALADTTADFRLLIYRDTWNMIQKEPATGVGLGMFGFVFPQYRHDSASAALCVHPESDWLMLAAEQGLGAALVLAAGILCLLVWAFRNARHRHAWALRWNGIVAAALVPLHGVFDVPGHRVGIALAAVYLLALSLREGHAAALPSKLCQTLWRCGGVAILVLGAIFLTSSGNAITQPTALLSEARSLYARDVAERAMTPPPPPSAEDKLEQGIARLDEAIRLSPLNPDLHFLRGFLAVHFTDMYDLADQAYGYQRKLSPLWTQLPLFQSDSWSPIDPKRTQSLWQEALARADVMSKLAPGADQARLHVIERMIYQSSLGGPELQSAVLPYAEETPFNLERWSHYAALPLLNEHLPRLLLRPELTPAQRETILNQWRGRGGTAEAAKFQAEHP